MKLRRLILLHSLDDKTHANATRLRPSRHSSHFIFEVDSCSAMRPALIGTRPAQSFAFCRTRKRNARRPGRKKYAPPRAACHVLSRAPPAARMKPCPPPGRSAVRRLARRMCAPNGQANPSGSVLKVKPFCRISFASPPRISIPEAATALKRFHSGGLPRQYLAGLRLGWRGRLLASR